MRFLRPLAYVSIAALSIALLFNWARLKPPPPSYKNFYPALETFHNRYPVAFLGLKLSAVSGALRTQLQLSPNKGIVVTEVDSASTQILSNIEPNDVLLEADKTPLSKPVDLQTAAQSAAGDPLSLKLIRQGKKLNVQAVIQAPIIPPPLQSSARAFRIGVSAVAVEPALAAQLGLTNHQGILITEVVADSPADKAGIKAHDIILTFAGKALNDPQKLSQIVQSNKDNGAQVQLIRAGNKQTLKIVPDLRPNPVVQSQFPPTPPCPVADISYTVVHSGTITRSTVPPTSDPPFSTASEPSIIKRLDDISVEIHQLRAAIDAFNNIQKSSLLPAGKIPDSIILDSTIDPSRPSPHNH